jgi:hypothetical protein
MKRTDIIQCLEVCQLYYGMDYRYIRTLKEIREIGECGLEVAKHFADIYKEMRKNGLISTETDEHMIQFFEGVVTGIQYRIMSREQNFAPKYKGLMKAMSTV